MSVDGLSNLEESPVSLGYNVLTLQRGAFNRSCFDGFNPEFVTGNGR